jgi:hypothetical protein
MKYGKDKFPRVSTFLFPFSFLARGGKVSYDESGRIHPKNEKN